MELLFQRNIVPACILRVSHWALGWSQNLLRCLLKRIDAVELICSLDLKFCARNSACEWRDTMSGEMVGCKSHGLEVL